MLFILRPAWRQRDPRLTVVARTLGWGSTRIFWLLTLPSLTRPLLTALGGGLLSEHRAVSANAMAGAGRIPTLTSRGGGAQQRRRGADARRSGAVAITAAGGMLYPDRSAGLGWQAAIDEDFASANRKPSDPERETPAAAAGGRLFGSPGEVLTLMGPSGSGNQRCLPRMIGALSGDFRARGELWLNERRCDTLPTEHRRIGILFQDPLLFDHFSVGQNLQLALPENVRGEARKTAVEEALSRAGLAGFAPRDPATLSGGQRARVSLLRALLARPEALLLDEPFSRLGCQPARRVPPLGL